MGESIYKSDAGREMISGWYENKLARFAVPVESRVVETFIGSTHMLVAGGADNPPAVILHGGFMNGAAMEAEIAALAPTHRVYAVDLPGQSGRSTERRLDMQTNEPVRWLAEVLDQLQIDQVDLVALSLGGLFALKFARNMPERIRKLVLLSAGGIVSGRGKGRRRLMRAVMRCRLRPTEKNFSRAAIKPFYGKEATPDLDLVRLMGMGFKHIVPDTAARSVPPFGKGAMSQLTAPVMVVYGEHDALFDGKAAVAQARKLFSNVATELVPGHGHFMGKDVQDGVLSRIAYFLNG